MANIQFYLIVFTALNIFLFSNAKYTGTPRKAAAFSVALRKSLELKCEYTGEDGNGQFLGWYKDGTLISNDKAQHYVVKNSKKESKLIIVVAQEDQEVNKWSVKTNKPDDETPIECQFNKISLKPSPQRMETDRTTEKLDPDHLSVRRVEDESVSFKCIIEPNQINQDRIRWGFSKNGGKFSKLPSGVQNITNHEIVIKQVKKTHRGYYRCVLNGVSFTALLRVKDPLAAFWPFLAIVITVLVLVIAILIYEKRQRTARKAAAAAAAAEDEVNDNPNDPLVQTSNKLSDNEKTTHTVKA